MTPTVLLWDIDGTLLSTARAGVVALVDAAREVLGTEPDVDGLKTAGLTDFTVMRLVAQAAGGPDDEETVRRMLEVYERRLPERLPLRDGRVLPGVEPILGALQDRDDVHSLLLTGNTERGAQAKLRHYGLERFFERGGAFCIDMGDRNSIAARAWEQAVAAAGPELSPDRTFVIGDTPYDIACGKSIGARTIAVATSTHGTAELREHDPWIVLDELPAPPQFELLLELR